MDSSKSTSNTPLFRGIWSYQWETNSSMNKLFALGQMGFNVSWKLIDIGLFGKDRIPVLLTHGEVLEYLDGLLVSENEHTDKIIAITCENNNHVKFQALLQKFANEDCSDITIQVRKWRAYLLNEIVNHRNADSLQGMIELMEFWMNMGNPNDSPHDYPDSNDSDTINAYFSKKSYEHYLKINFDWLLKEIHSIIKSEEEDTLTVPCPALSCGRKKF